MLAHEEAILSTQPGELCNWTRILWSCDEYWDGKISNMSNLAFVWRLPIFPSANEAISSSYTSWKRNRSRIRSQSSKENRSRGKSPRADNLKSDQSLSRPVQVGLFWSNAAKSELLNGHWWGWKLWHLTYWGGLKTVELWNFLFKDQVLNHHP